MNGQQDGAGYAPQAVVLAHLSGSKAGQREEFQLSAKRELTLGRSNQSDVAFDPMKDDVVSREHARISQQADNPAKFTVEDAASRNGVYLNGRKVEGSAALSHGDKVSLGVNGPSFTFSLSPPPPAGFGGQTREASRYSEEIRATRAGGYAPPPPTTTAGKTGIGKDTVERIVAESNRKQRSSFLYLLGGLLVLAAGVAGFFLIRSGGEPAVVQSQKDPRMSVADIAKANQKTVVFIEVGWKLINTETGREVYHVCDPTGKGLFFRMADGSIEPVVTLEPEAFKKEGLTTEMILDRGAGSGFVVQQTGHILTNRHVAAGWHAPYTFPEGTFPGRLISRTTFEPLEREVLKEDVAKWIPAKTHPDAIVENFMKNAPSASSGKRVEGQHTYLDVTFAGNDVRTTAKLIRTSTKHDVAMIKIDLPTTLDKVALFDNYASIAAGDEVTCIGYPGAAPDLLLKTKSQDALNRSSEFVKIPFPNPDGAAIGQIFKGSVKISSDQNAGYFSEVGDLYQLNDANVGPGSSGGPVFDSQGRVIGIVNSGFATADGTIRFAYVVPIKYGIELMNTNQVIE